MSRPHRRRMRTLLAALALTLGRFFCRGCRAASGDDGLSPSCALSTPPARIRSGGGTHCRSCRLRPRPASMHSRAVPFRPRARDGSKPHSSDRQSADARPLRTDGPWGWAFYTWRGRTARSRRSARRLGPWVIPSGNRMRDNSRSRQTRDRRAGTCFVFA
jgi:hypothetical protein